MIIITHLLPLVTKYQQDILVKRYHSTRKPDRLPSQHFSGANLLIVFRDVSFLLGFQEVRILGHESFSRFTKYPLQMLNIAQDVPAFLLDYDDVLEYGWRILHPAISQLYTIIYIYTHVARLKLYIYISYIHWGSPNPCNRE